MRKIISLLLALCLVVGMVPVAASATETSLPEPDNGVITLNSDVNLTQSYNVEKGKTVVLDLHGYTITTADSFIVEGTLTIKDTTATVPPVIDDSYSNVDYHSGKIVYTGDNFLIKAQNGGNVVFENGSADATKNGGSVGVALGDKTGEKEISSTFTVKDGYLVSSEFTLMAQGKGATLNVNGGIIEATDNAVIGGNGSNTTGNYCGGTAMNISGGILVGGITTPEYIACGIYHPQEGTLNITGGTIYAANGVGVLMRGGKLDITNGTIIATSSENCSGKVGDSDISIDAGSAIVYDRKCNYYNASDVSVDLRGGKFTSAQGKPAISVVADTLQLGKAKKKIAVSGGTYSSNIKEFLTDGNTAVTDSNGNYIVEVVNSQNAVAKIGKVYYRNLNDAFKAVKGTDKTTIEILKDVVLDSSDKKITLTDKNVVLDLGNHLISALETYSAESFVVVGSGASLTIQGTGDASIDLSQAGAENLNVIKISAGELQITGGKIIGRNIAVEMTGGEATISGNASVTGSTAVKVQGASLTVANNAFLKGNFGVILINSPASNSSNAKNASFTMTGGTITATSGFALSGNNTQSAGCEAEITGGKLEQTSGETCIYWPIEGALTIGGNAIVEGGSGIEARMGTITIQDGAAIKGTREYLDLTKYEQDGETWPVSGSSQADGSAILISSEMYGDNEGQYQSNPGLTVNIKGGTLTSEKGNAVTVYNLESTSNENTKAAINVTDGTLNAAHGKAAVLVEAKNEKSEASLETSEGTPSVKTKALKTVVTVSSNVVSAVADQAGKTAFYAEGDDFDVDPDTAPTKNAPLNLFVLKNTSIHSAALGNEHTTLTVPEDVELYVTSEKEDYVVQKKTNEDGSTTYQLVDSESGGEENVPKAPTSVVLSANKTTAYKGEKITLTATVQADAGTQLEYAWYKDGAFISKTDSNTYAITEGGSYTVFVRAVMTDESETVYSNAIQSKPVICSFISRPTNPSYPGGGDDNKPEEPAFPFTDVKSTAWYYNAVKYVYENNLMAGTGDTTFDPEVSLTRAMTAQILYNLEGQPKVDEEATFADMNEAPTWSVDAIAWAQDTGVVAGMGDNQFAPNAKVTREQFAQMMYNYAKYKKYDLTKTGDLSKFPDDGSVSDWAETAMSWANGNGLINGHEDSGLIDPAGNTIRGQAASIIMNFDKNVVK